MKILVMAIFLMLFFTELVLVIQQERNQIFATSARKTGVALMEFAQSRAQLVQRNSNESFEQYEQRIATQNARPQPNQAPEIYRNSK